MKKIAIFGIIVFAIIYLIFFNSNYKKFDDLRGDLVLNEFYHNGICFSCQNLYKLKIDKLSSWINIENMSHNNAIEFVAKYEFEKSNGQISLEITEAKPEFLNGIYNVKIDTLSSSIQRDEFAITLESKNIKMKGYKSIVKKIGK